MNENLAHYHEATRHIRKTFMLAMIAVGQKAIDEIRLNQPDVYQSILHRFPEQPSRAAFWLVDNRNAGGRITPLQQLMRNELPQFNARLLERN